MGRLFFVCDDGNTPNGGVKQLYRQVDVLNENGFNAFVLHRKFGFKCSWFINDTKVAYNYKLLYQMETLLEINNISNNIIRNLKWKIKKTLKRIKAILHNKQNDIRIEHDDVLILPEIYGPYVGGISKGNKKIIYNQGVYQTFFHHNLSLTEKTTPYLNDEFIATIVNSENANEYLHYAFPELNVKRVRYGIDSRNFYPTAHKKMKIAYMPRRLRVDLIQVINILKFRGVLKNWELVEIHNMSERQVADNLRECAIFLSFSINEGFGMPPAEAMACGCVVVGYAGKGGKEFFKEDFCYPIEDRDVVSFAQSLEKVILDYEKDNTIFIEKGKRASDFILSEYSMEMEEKTITDCWNSILN